MARTILEHLEYEIKNDGNPIDVGFLIIVMPIILPMQILGMIVKKLAEADNQ